jgi:chromosome segregation ATPase
MAIPALQITAIAVSVLGFLFGGGLLKYLSNRIEEKAIIKTKVLDLEKRADKLSAKIQAHDTTIALQGQSIASLSEAMKKLDDLPKILTALGVLGEKIASIERQLNRLDGVKGEPDDPFCQR